MEPNPKSKTVRGLNVAVIILAVLGLIGCIALAAFTALVSTAVNENSADIAASIQNLNLDDEAVKVDIDTQDRESIDKALSTIEGFENVDTSKMIDLLQMLKEGDDQGILDMFTKDDGSLDELITSFTGLSDAQLTELAASIEGVEASDLIGLRDLMVTVRASDLGNVSGKDVVEGTNILMTGISYTAIAFGAVMILLSLIAGILGCKNAYEPKKLGSAFAMGIVGAAASLLCLRLVTMVLLIISCVQINKVRKNS